MWYAAYLVYSLEPNVDAPRETVFTLQEDLLLLEAHDGEEAYTRALSLGAEVGDFGRRALEGEANALGELGLGAEWAGRLLHPSNATLYKAFHFLGLRDLVPIRSVPDNGTEIDIREVTLRDELAAITRSSEDLHAFSPVGAAYEGTAKTQEQLRLYRRYPWYLAEQIYRRPEGHSESRSKAISVISRLVLLYAGGPEEALRLAIEDGSRWAQRSIDDYVGIRQLSLVDDDLRDGCELRSSLIRLPKEEAAVYVRAKTNLKPFARQT